MLASDTWRAPRLRVLAGGVMLPGVIAASVIASGGFAADFFRVRAAVSGDAAYWTAQTVLPVDVQVALGPLGAFVSLVQGNADAIGLDPVAGVLTIEGRDYAAALIEARTQETFANRTASEIATLIAARHSLAADVQPTTTPAGRYWELEHDSLTLDAGARATTEWDLLAMLAGWEGFDLWVSGTTLHFRPPDTITPPPVLSSVPTLSGPADFSALRLDRALSFAGDIVVTVKSWHSRIGAGTAQTARMSRGGTSAQDYAFVVPNLSPEAAALLAQRRLAEIASHELLLRGEMPGELALSPRMAFRLAGTGTLFDTLWRIDEVERRISMHEGFSQSVVARAAGA
ncbi:MAG TPA: hypothetical protein VFN46_09295 [Acetobacteraceae bacterium]|nr:hypothetical protein [Acetobacteraceae bacterium]